MNSPSFKRDMPGIGGTHTGERRELFVQWKDPGIIAVKYPNL
jgi:hypothetical protein